MNNVCSPLILASVILLDNYSRLHLPMNAPAQNMFSEFQVSNFEVSPPKCEVLLLNTAQREVVSNQQKRKKLSERRHTFNDLRNQVKELTQDYSFSEVVDYKHLPFER